MISSRNALVAVLAGLGITSSVFAGASNKNPNPFGNGSYFSQNGTFSAVLRSPEQPNFLGVVQVSTTTTNYGSANTNASNPISTGWATVFTPGVQNYPVVTRTTGAAGIPSISYVTNTAFTNITNFTYTQLSTTNYFTNIVTNQIPNPTNTNTFSFVTNTNYTSNTIVRTITNTNVYTTNIVISVTGITNKIVPGLTASTNFINVPGIQWNGGAFGVLGGSSGNTLNVTYTLASSVSQVYTNNNNITSLSLTNLNGGGQFSANLQNNYPNQSFSGSGFCSVSPSIGGNPSNSTPVLNFTNTVSGLRLSQ